MKKMIMLLLFSLITLLACGKKAKIVTLDKESPAYRLGKELSPILPVMDPDSNRVLVTAQSFRISAGEVLNVMKSFMGERTEDLLMMDKQRLSVLIKQVTTELIEKKLLLNAANKTKVRVAPAEIDSVLNLQYQRAGGQAQYTAFLTDTGIDLEFVKKDIKNSLIINHYLDGIVEERSRVTEEQIQDAYHQFLQDTSVSVRHIMLLTKDITNEEKKKARRKIEEILARVQKGEDFGELAREFSEDPGSKEKSGLYEGFSRGDMVKPFEDAAFTVPVGEISDIVETEFGYHIIKVIDRSKNDKPLEEVRSELADNIRGPEGRNIIPTHIEELIEEENVEMIEF